MCRWVSRPLIGLLLLVGAASCLPQTPIPPPPPTPVVATLWIGVTPDAAPLGGFLTRQFSDEAFDIQVVVGPAAELEADLAAGRIDGVIAHEPPPIAEWFNPIAVDGLLLIVHPDNPVLAINQQTARQLLSGRQPTWTSAGGNDAAVELFVREAGSSGRSALGDMLMTGLPVPVTSRTISSDQKIVEATALAVNGLGIIWAGHLDGTVRSLTLDSVSPNGVTLADQSYPLAAPLYLSSVAEPEGPLRQLVAWLQGEEGQGLLIAETNYGRVDGR